MMVAKGSFDYNASFVGLIIALSAVQLYSVFIKTLPTIKLPGDVPPAIFNSFFALIPTFVLFIIFALIRLLVETLGFGSIIELEMMF
ncbi:MAG: PTS transporter subunit EIIC, partial [Bacilli bacterium]